MVIPQLDFVSDDRMVAYGDSEIAIFEGTQKPKLAQEIPLTGGSKKVFFNNNKYVGVVYSNNDEKLTHHVAVYDMHGFTVMEKDFSQEYTEIGFLSNNEVCILNDHSCDIYTVRGIYKFHYDFDEELLQGHFRRNWFKLYDHTGKFDRESKTEIRSTYELVTDYYCVVIGALRCQRLSQGLLTHDVFYGIMGDHVCAGNVGDAVYQYISEG